MLILVTVTMVKIEQYAEFMYELLNAQLGINQHKLIKYYTKIKVVQKNTLLGLTHP